MKKFKMVLMAMLAICTVALTSCSKDDDTDNNTDNENTDNGGQNNGASGIENMQISETANQIIATWKIGDAGYTIFYKWIFDFDGNDLCTRATLETTFPTVELAQIAYREATDEEDDDYEVSINGKTIIVVYHYYRGNTKDEIRQALNLMKNGYNGGGDNNGGNNGGYNGGNDDDDEDLISYDDPHGLMPDGTTYWEADHGDETGVFNIILTLTKVKGNKYTFALGLTGMNDEGEFGDYYVGTVYFSPYTGSGTVEVNMVQGRLTNADDARLRININTADEIEIFYDVNGGYGATLTQNHYGK